MCERGQMKLKDQVVRDRIGRSLDENLLVEAAAGTGKTTALVSRLVSLFEQGKAEADQIVAVTFTRKAAGELRLRLREALDFRRLEVDNSFLKSNLDRALGLLEEAHIGTIHSFCAELLRERPVEAQVDPEFRELAEDETSLLLDRLFRNWIQDKLSDLPVGIKRALNRVQLRTGFGVEEPIERLRQSAARILEWRDYPTPWKRSEYSREDLMDQILGEAFRLAGLCSDCSDSSNDLLTSLRPVTDLTTWITRAESERARDYDFLEGQLIELEKRLNRGRFVKKGRPFSENVSRTRIIQAKDQLLASLGLFQEKADADLASSLHRELQEFVSYFESQKRSLAVLDFSDLLLLTGRMLRENRDVRFYFQNRFTHIFVDEFQDTDGLQAEILLLLASDSADQMDWRMVTPVPGKLFLVGDPKQSIYRFRRADVTLYQEIKQQLRNRGVSVVNLTQNFRSVRSILELVNASFCQEMTGDIDSGQADYVAFDDVRKDCETQPSVIVLPVPAPYGKRDIAKYAVRQSYPGAVTSMIEWLIFDSNWKVNDPVSGKPASISPKHIAILFRSFVSWGEDITREYTRGLEARGIMHLLVGSRSFHQREEVQTLKTALTAIEWPDDELSVYAVLRGSLFSISDRTLFRFRENCGNLHPFGHNRSDSKNKEFAPVLQCLEFLGGLHKKRNLRPIVDTLNELFAYTRAHAGFALRPAGHQVLANVQRVFDLARSLETQRNLSFRSFVEFLEIESEKSSSSESPVFEEGIDGVRLMTVHGAKGLEFPIVLLADPGCPISFSKPSRFIDHEKLVAAYPLLGCEPLELRENREIELEKDRAEGTRIAYVAATRARDLLIIPGVGDGPFSGWLDPLNKGIYPAKELRRRAQPAQGCPRFGSSTVIERCQYLDGRKDFSVHPGLHHFSERPYEIVWWDPAVLKLGTSANFGLRQAEILTEDSEGTRVKESLDQYLKWEDIRENRASERFFEKM